MRVSTVFFLIANLFFTCLVFSSDNLRREINLAGKWKFQIGDNNEYAEANYDDSNWNDIYVPSKWENCGYDGYDGMAWYRIKVFIPKSLDDRMLFLKLGCIDNADCVYINGQYIGGTGNLYDKSSTTWTVKRNYPIDHSFIRFGKENIIAVQVWDNQSHGGIYKGSIGLYSQQSLDLFINLSGSWKARIGDRSDYSQVDYNDDQWEEGNVPSTWSVSGWGNMDGFAWYRKRIKISSRLKGEKLVLVLGRIDDSDRVYLNGILIGTTGNMPDTKGPFGNDSWNKERVYYLPDHVVLWDQNNTIAIRVYDHGARGGIYTGPVGITTQESYLKYQNQ